VANDFRRQQFCIAEGGRRVKARKGEGSCKRASEREGGGERERAREGGR